MLHVLHALLGSSLAELKDGKVTAWTPTQNPQAAQDIVAKEMGIPKENAEWRLRAQVQAGLRRRGRSPLEESGPPGESLLDARGRY